MLFRSEADPFTGQPVATPLSASYKDQIEQMVGMLANRTGKFSTGGGEPKLAGSVMGETRDRLANVVAGYLKMFAPDPTDLTGMGGTIVPKGAVRKMVPGGFSRAELKGQKVVHNQNPKLLRALREDKRPGAEYTLAFENIPKSEKGNLRAGRTSTRLSGEKRAPGSTIDIELDPRYAGMDTPIHEAEHAFSLRRNPAGSGSSQHLGEFESLPKEFQMRYIRMNNNPQHAATAYRADQAAYRLGLAPTPFSSIGR